MKDRTRLLSQLASLVGDLRPGPSASAADLVAVQRLAARALLDGAIDAAPPSGPMEPGADIDALAALIDEAAGEGAELLVSRRSLPVFHAGLAGSVPPWAEGRAVERTVGPFQDRLGRHIWIDLFRIVRQLRLVRSAGAEPFLTLPISLAAGPAPSPARTTYDLPAGSIWVASRLLAPGAPASSFTGLRIRGGRLQFTQPIAISGNEVVVPAAVQCLLELELEPESAPAGSGDGADARAAQSEPPRRVTLHVGALGATFPSVGPGRVAAYGYPVHLSQTPGAVEYLPDLQRLAVPLAADARTFQVRSVASRLFQPSGEAPILRAAWGLPVAVSSPASLGDASGSGNLLLWIDKGLRAKWLDQPNEVALGPSVLMADPAQLSLAAPAASAQGEQQRLALWSGGAPSTALLRYEQRFALRFSSQAAGHEALLTGASLTATMDRPVDVRGARLTLRARDAQVTLLAGPQGVFALIEAALEIPAGLARLGLAIRNALFVVAPPSTLRLLTGLDAANRDTGACVLAFRRRALVPTLPDPYAANAGPLRATLDQPGGELLSLVTWRPASPVRLDFILPAGTAAPAPAGAFTGLVAQPIDGGAPDLLAARAFAGRDVLSGAIKALGGALAFERRRALILLDVSTNTDQFGVAVARTGRDDDGGSRALAVQDLYLQAGSVELLTLPAVQWEAVITPSDPNDPTFPRRLGFATSGVPTVIDVPSVRLVAVHPRAALDTLVDNFALPAPRPARARFTLPFGMIASAVLEKPGGATTRGAELRYNRPRTSDLEGGHQLSIQAVDTSLPAAASPSLSGFTAQLPVGQPGWRSALGDAVTITFNSYLGAGGFRPLVPVTRLDLSGYGESLFSDWRNPYPDPVAVSQARFDVLVGRTAREVVQTRSYLYPYAVQVVRTITIERRNNAVVQRRDSGWQPVSDGIYAFPGAPRVETHPGVVKRITNISGIRDTGEIVTIDGIQLAAVRFDGDLELDGAPALVPARDQLGYVQLTAGNLMAPATYARLIEAVGPLGGAVDANLQIGGGGQAMRARRVGVGVTRVMGGPEFVMTAWGSPAFPGGGEWSFLRAAAPDLSPVAVPRDGVPLIRAGRASMGPPPLNSPYRFADPVDLAQPASPGSDYGILHATGTQRALFPRPKIEAADPSRITSTLAPVLADPYTLATALGMFPEISRAIPFPSAAWALRIGAGGSYLLELPSSTFPLSVGRRTLRQAGSVRGDVDYTGATVTYEIDTSQPVPWRFALTGARKVMSSSIMGDVITVGANVRASADRAAVFTEPRLQLGGSLSVVQDLLTILEDVGITGVMRVAMTNEWSIAVGLTVPFKDAAGDDLKIPPLVPTPDIIFADTGVSVEVKVWRDADEAEFSLGGQPMFAIKSIPNLYVVAIIEFRIKLSTETGTTYSLTLGVGIAYVIKADPFELKGLFALTFFGFIGDTTIGFGVGFLVKVSLELVIIEVSLTLEGKLALVWACRGAPDETLYGAAKLTFAVEVTVAFIFSISFEYETTAERVLSGPGGAACPLPDVIP